jgi:hypothetical protein
MASPRPYLDAPLVRREGETVQRAMIWEAWRKIRVIRRAAA